MPIPKHTEIRVQVLEYLKKFGPAGSKQMVGPLSEYFRLTPEEVTQMYESGKGPVFKARINWAITYLGFTDLIVRKSRAIYAITPEGIEMLKTPEKIDAYIDHHLALKEARKSEKSNTEAVTTEVPIKPTAKVKSTPQEDLYQSYAHIKKSINDEILDTIVGKSPRAFEILVVSLLQKMGYGGEIKDSGVVTQYTNDQGIDGIIKEDVLGLGRIHIQAKKYARETAIQRDDIQKFVGALAVAQSNKGVFITTSYFSKGAMEYVKNLNGRTNIVLINGEELANYIYDYNLGMQVEQVITIKKLDSDFWDEMEDK
jgi:restriction system protein